MQAFTLKLYAMGTSSGAGTPRLSPRPAAAREGWGLRFGWGKCFQKTRPASPPERGSGQRTRSARPNLERAPDPIWISTGVRLPTTASSA